MIDFITDAIKWTLLIFVFCGLIGAGFFSVIQIFTELNALNYKGSLIFLAIASASNGLLITIITAVIRSVK